jgi:hypothetical protein
MPTRSAIFALLLSSAIVAAAEPPQLRTLADTSVSGELVGISGKSVILKVAGKNVETPLDQVLTLDLASVPKEPPEKDAKYIDVELTDGTLLHCEKFAMKGRERQATLLSGQAVKIPMAHVRYYINEANDKTFRPDWDKYLAKKTGFDQLMVFSTNSIVDKVTGKPVDVKVLNSIPVTFGDADEKGETIEFALPNPKSDGSANTRTKKVSEVNGIVFKRDPNPKAAPVVCKVYDLHANVIVASAVALDGDKVYVTTPDGVKLELGRSSLARLDYSHGKLAYLSDWDSKNMKVSEEWVPPQPGQIIPPFLQDVLKLTEDQKKKLEELKKEVDTKLEMILTDEQKEEHRNMLQGGIGHFRRDRNLAGGPITLGGREFSKGLAIHVRTAFEYDLAGEFREFKAVIGVDELVRAADGVTKVVVKGDGKELKVYEVSRKDKPLDVTLNIHKVKSLTIEVLSAEILNLGHHVDLADARVTK